MTIQGMITILVMMMKIMMMTLKVMMMRVWMIHGYAQVCGGGGPSRRSKGCWGGRTRAVTRTDGEVIKNVPGLTWKARGQTEERKGRGRTIRRDCLGNWRPPLKVIPDLSTRGEWLPDQLSVISRGRYEEAHFCCPNRDARWPVIFTLLRATENKRRKTMMTTGRTCFFSHFGAASQNSPSKVAV